MATSTGLRFTLTRGDGASNDAGADLAVVDFHLEEALSRPFELTVTLASPRPDLAAGDWLEREVTLTVWQDGAALRRVHGVVAEFAQGDRGHRRTFYTLLVRPALWRLSLRHNSRIFQQVSPLTIINTLLAERGIQDATFAVTREPAEREYCVQYRETDLAFIERLAAEEGLFYCHEFEDKAGGAHRLVFADAPNVLGNLGPRTYHSRSGGTAPARHLRRLRQTARVRPASAMLKDYSFKQPAYSQLHQAQLHEQVGSELEEHAQRTDYEHFDYPGRYKADASGQAFTKTRLEQLRSDALTVNAESDLPELRPGARFTLTEHDSEEMNRGWQVIKVVHKGTQPQALEEDAVGGEGATTYTNTLILMPADQPWRAELNAKPRVDGPQVAFVVGPEGEEIHCDAHGRVKVQFPWDRYAKPDDTASAWIRVAQGWAGGGYGAIAIPRVGHEVIVSFLEGDPDQPLITGRTYHAVNTPPYALPEHKTRTVIRTQTHQGEGFNELRFEDAQDNEQIWVHAQKDLELITENDRTEAIHRDSHLAVQRDRLSAIERDDHLHVHGERREQIDGDDHRIVGQTCHERYGRAQLVETGREVHYQAGKQAVFEAGAEITLAAGGSFLKLDPSGITISGPGIRVNAGGSPGSGTGQAALAALLPGHVVPESSERPSVVPPAARLKQHYVQHQTALRESQRADGAQDAQERNAEEAVVAEELQLAALIPVRYALGYEELSSDFLSVLDVPDLGGSLLAESDAQESVPLSYVARPLRDGWCYVWLETQRRLVEYRVTQGMLDETSRGGPIVMPGGGAYLFLPADAPARLAWSPVRWSERHYAKLQGNSEHRQALMRAIVPGQGPASGPLAWATQVPELNGAPPSVFAWSSEPGAELPRWETMMPTLTQAEIQAVAVIDDPWGLLLDLAHLVRAVLNRREAWFAEEGEERSLAQQILALAKQNREFWAELPTLADQPRIEEAATRYDAEIAERDAQLAALLADWQCWMETTQAQGASLQAAQRHFDPAEAEHHDAMETLWSAVLLGPTQSRAGAASVERLMDPARSFWAPDTEHSLWAALLGHREPLTLADVTRLLAVGDLGADNDWQGWANGLNQLSATLGQTSAALREGLFVALGPLIGPLLKQHGAASAHHTLVAGYFAAALARSGQRLSATPVPAQVMVDWLNAPGARAANAPASLGRLRPDLLPELQGKTLTTLRLAAPASAPTGNPFVEALGDARLKSLLLILNGVMLVEAGEALVEEGRSFDTTTGFLSSLFGTAAVAGAIGQQVLELKADRVLATEGMSAVWKARYEFFLIAGQGTSFTLGLATAFDSVYFGRQALDSLGRGDRDSAAVQAGMSAASAGQAALAARAFWLYRRARAALLMGRTLEASALASRAGAPGAMLGLVLLIVGGAISLRFTREKPLQQWLRNTRFGTHPAAWAGDLAQELDRLFRLLYAPRARLERRDEWNHALNTRHVAVWLTIEFPGATPPFPGMFTWQAKERWKAGWFGSETRDVVLTEKDLALDIGERHRGGPAYRRIYHATPEDETLLAIGGTLHYRPHPGLILQPFTLSID